MAQISERQITRLESLLVSLQDVVGSLRPKKIPLPPEIVVKLAIDQAENRCCFCGQPLGEDKVTRGCHHTCYSVLKGRVKRGELTMDNVLQKGWMTTENATPGRRRATRPDPMRAAKPSADKNSNAAIAADALSGALAKGGKRAAQKAENNRSAKKK